MTTAQIIALARNQTGGTTTSQISDDQMLIYLNTVYQELFSEIAEKTDKKLTWQEWTADTVANQSEYTLPILNTWTEEPGLKRLLNIYIKYTSSDTYYTKLQVLDYEEFSASPDYLQQYEDWKATESGSGNERSYPYPLAVRADEYSIFLNPAPEEAVTGWLKIQWIYTPLDLTTTSIESDIKLPREFHDLLAVWMEQYVWGYRQLDSKRNIAMNRYMVLKQNILSQMNNVEENASRDALPDLAYLE